MITYCFLVPGERKKKKVKISKPKEIFRPKIRFLLLPFSHRHHKFVFPLFYLQFFFFWLLGELNGGTRMYVSLAIERVQHIICENDSSWHMNFHFCYFWFIPCVQITLLPLIFFFNNVRIQISPAYLPFFFLPI